MMKTRTEIEEMSNKANDAYDENASDYHEAVMNTLAWVLGDFDPPIE